MTAKSEVGKHLHEMDRMELRHRLEFYHDEILYHEVETITAVEVDSLVHQGHGNLALE